MTLLMDNDNYFPEIFPRIFSWKANYETVN